MHTHTQICMCTNEKVKARSDAAEEYTDCNPTED